MFILTRLTAQVKENCTCIGQFENYGQHRGLISEVDTLGGKLYHLCSPDSVFCYEFLWIGDKIVDVNDTAIIFFDLKDTIGSTWKVKNNLLQCTQVISSGHDWLLHDNGNWILYNSYAFFLSSNRNTAARIHYPEPVTVFFAYREGFIGFKYTKPHSGSRVCMKNDIFDLRKWRKKYWQVPH